MTTPTNQAALALALEAGFRHAAGFTDAELDLFVGAAAALGQPMPAADRALVDEAIRLYALGKTL